VTHDDVDSTTESDVERGAGVACATIGTAMLALAYGSPYLV
jgi:hypothetical protein